MESVDVQALLMVKLLRLKTWEAKLLLLFDRFLEIVVSILEDLELGSELIDFVLKAYDSLLNLGLEQLLLICR